MERKDGQQNGQLVETPVSSGGEMTRRNFLKIAAAGAGAAGFGAIGWYLDSKYGWVKKILNSSEQPVSGEIKEFELNDKPSTLEAVDPKVDEYPIRIDTSKEYKLPNSEKWFPDTRTSWIKSENGIIVFGSAGVNSVRMEGKNWANLGKAEVVMTPDNTQNEIGFNGYRGLSTVIRRDNGALVGIIHKENWKSQGQHFPFTAEIECAVSYDDGHTWTKPVTVLSGKGVEKNAADVQGIGQPGCIVDSKGNLFTYYIDWQGPDNIHLAKVDLSDVENPDAWKKWDGQGFNQPGIGGDSVPVVESDNSYVALPQLLWDSERSMFVMLNEQDKGFYVRTSADGISWNEEQMIVKVPSPLSTRKTENDWYSYPTIISGSDDQFIIGNAQKYLLTSRGIYNVNAHKGVLLPIEIG